MIKSNKSRIFPRNHNLLLQHNWHRRKNPINWIKTSVSRFGKLITCSLSSSSCSRICRLQAILRLNYLSVIWSQDQKLQLLLSTATGILEHRRQRHITKVISTGKLNGLLVIQANNKSLHRVLIPMLRVIPLMGTALPWTSLSKKFLSNPVQMQAGIPRYDTCTEAIPYPNYSFVGFF